MLDRSGKWFAPSARLVAVACGAALALTIASAAAWCQNAPPSPSPAASPPAQPAPPDPPAVPPDGSASPANPPAHQENPGLINEIGKMFGKLKTPSETIDDLNVRAKDAAKDASDSLSRLTTSSIVSGRAACPASGNGAPDCQTGSDKLCQSKGFKTGKSLATDSAESCSAKVLIPGRSRKPDDCHTNTYVTPALCQ
jgi:hypothetical protein